MRFFFAVIFFISSWAIGVRAQIDVVIEENNPALFFSNAFQWQKFTNPQALGDGTVDNNYWHGGGAVAISLPGSSVTLTFNGSYIAYYGDLNSDHGKIEVLLDGQRTIVDSYRPSGPAKQVKLYEANLDPNVPNHQITLTCAERRQMSFDYFQYKSVEPNPSSMSTSSTSTVSTIIESPGSSSAHTDNAAIIATAVLAAIGWLLVIVLCFVILRFRGRRDTHHSMLQVNPSGPEALSSITSDMRIEASNFHQPQIVTSEPPSAKQRAIASLAASSPGSESVSNSGATSGSFSRAKAGATASGPPAYSNHV